KASDFPLLVKFIFPTDKLSIQVHPDDAYASVHEKAAGGRGKTEMWHVVSAKPDASVLVGLKPGVSKQQFLAALETHTLEDLFQRHVVEPGDTFFVPAGTPHTISPGMILCEVQQYSDLTYRVYDYGRVDSHGNPRELHLEKAMNVMNFDRQINFRTRHLAIKSADMKQAIDDKCASILAACKYFATAKWDFSRALPFGTDPDEFCIYVFVSGSGQIVWNDGSSSFGPGECWFVPAEYETLSVVPRGPTQLLEVWVPNL